MEISTLKTSLALDSQKNSSQRIRGITRRRSESNARGACRIIGDNSTSRFCTIKSHGNDSKTRKLDYELKSRERRFFICEQLIQRQQRKGFFASDCDWRNGYSTTTLRRKKYYAKLSQSLLSISTSTPWPKIHGSKIMLCIWDQNGLVYYELLKPGDSITDDRYR